MQKAAANFSVEQAFLLVVGRKYDEIVSTLRISGSLI